MTIIASLIQFYRVFNHEYIDLVRSKLFRVLTLIILLVIMLVFSIPGATANISVDLPATTVKSLLIVDATGLFTVDDFSFESSAYAITFQQENAVAGQQENAAAGRQGDAAAEQQRDAIVERLLSQIDAGIYDDALFISNETTGDINIDFVTKSVIDNLPNESQTLVAAANIKNIMSRYGIPQTAIEKALAAPVLNIITTSNRNIADGFIPTYIFTMLMFYSIIIYGVMVASGVAQEKSSRAMEVLITSARTGNLIMGKIIGIGLAGLTQLAIWIIGMLIFYRVNFSYWKDIEIINGLLGTGAANIAYMLLFYLLGFFMFAALYGAIGSIVSRTEDIQLTQLPITLVLIVGLFGTTVGMAMQSPLLTVFSFIPIYAPISMFARISTSDVPIWQIVLSVALSAATVAAFFWGAVKIYRVGVLMYGKTPSAKEVFRALREDKM